jgi:hypothetical protein
MIRKYLFGLCAVLFPSALLFPNGMGFATDWHNHVWMVGYFGEYFRQHGTFPIIVDPLEYGGLAFPLFYGYLFYPLLGATATHVHPEYVVRCAAVLLFAAQYLGVRRTLRGLGADGTLASGTACLAIWSVYALTNLYSRSALTEFFATGALTCAVCAWFDLLRAPSVGAVWRCGIRFGLLLTLAVGFHPITGLYSLTLLPVLLCALPGRTVRLGRLLAVCAVAAVLAVVVLAPWVYAVARFKDELRVSGGPAAIADFHDSLDDWRMRMNPLPADRRCADQAPQYVSTPYVDAQVGWPLVLVALGTAGAVLRRLRGRARFTTVVFLIPPVLYTATMLHLSLSPEAFPHLPAVFTQIQFLCRLITYINLGLLLVPLFALLGFAQKRPEHTPPLTVSRVPLCAVLVYAACCVGIKLHHAEAARVPPDVLVKRWADLGVTYQPHPNHIRLKKSLADRAALAHLPLSSYGHNDYATPRLLAPLTAAEEGAAVHAHFGADPRIGAFGVKPPRTVTLDRATYVPTEILMFPWHRFEVDGQEVRSADLRCWSGLMTAVPVPAGTHTLRYRSEPDPTWLLLHRTSRAVLLAWFGALGALGVARWRHGRPARAAGNATPEGGGPPAETLPLRRAA